MGNANTVHEPSMDEILASIREIISEDGGGGAGPKIDGVRSEAAVGPRKEPPSPELEASATAQDGASPDGGPADTMEDQVETAGPQEEAGAEGQPSPAFDFSHLVQRGVQPQPPLQPQAQTPAPPRGNAPLLSRESGEAISGAFGALARTMLAQNSRTLEDVVIEMLGPMLKQWLDDNLPSIVERKVQEEIERVSRGRR